MAIKKNINLVKARINRGFANTWYLYLVYEYDAEDGKHRQIFPHVVPPFLTNFLPEIDNVMGSSPYGEVNSVIRPDRDMMLVKAHPEPLDIPDEHFDVIFKNDPAFVYDILVAENVHEMTLEEVQKKLGYKIKLVSKEDEE